MRWLLLTCIAFAIGCAPARVCAPRTVTPGVAFLWEVRSPGPSAGTLTLFGTHHVAAEQDVPASAWAALDAAEIFVAEAEEPMKGETFDREYDIREAMELPAGQSLMKMLSDDDFIELRQRLGVSNSRLARMRPWVAMSLLVRTMFDFPDPNMPAALSDRAEKAHAQMEYLDTWMHQTVFLDMTVDAKDLSGALHDENLVCSVRAGADAYRAGDESVFVKGMRGNPSSTGAEAAAIATREQVWTDKLIELMSRGKRVFVAIGVANIVGPTGIAARLERAGYTVTRAGSPTLATR